MSITRKSQQERKSKETSIEVGINLDGSAQGQISTGVHFFDHMLDQLKR